MSLPPRMAALRALRLRLASFPRGVWRYAAEVRELEAFYQQRGINSVPALVLNDRHLVSGSQSVEYYEQMLRQMASASAEA